MEPVLYASNHVDYVLYGVDEVQTIVQRLEPSLEPGLEPSLESTREALMRLVTRSAMKTRLLRAHTGIGVPAQNHTVLIRLALLWYRVVDRQAGGWT